MKQIFDQLKTDKKMVEANSPEELKQIVDQDLAYLEGVKFTPYDSSRQALNTRIINLTQLPIDIGKDNTPSYIKKPSFIFPINLSEVPIAQLNLLCDNFQIIGHLRDTHKSTIWQMSHNENFTNLVWERESLIFKTYIQLPEIVKQTLIYGKKYYFRAKYKGKRYDSEWSEPIKITLQKVPISKPVILLPLNESIINENVFRLIASAFTTNPPNGSTHTKTIWHVAEDVYFQETIWKEETHIFLTEINVPTINILSGKTYYVKCQYIDNWDSKSAFSDTLKVYSKYQIEKPIILNPINENIISRREITIVGNTFKTYPYSHNKMKAYEICVARDLNFQDMIVNLIKDGTTCNYLVAYERLDFDTVYYIKIRYYGENEKSEWSDVVAIRTSKISIVTPQILSPLEDTTVSAVLFNINCSEFTTLPINDDIHTKTTYEISKTVDFSEKIYETTSVEHLSFLSLAKPSLFTNIEKIFIRVKFHSLKGDSSWSEVREVNLFTAALPVTPILEKRLKSSIEFGSDLMKNIGRLITDVVLNDAYDSIVWSKWILSTADNFGENREERIISTDPKKLLLNRTDSYFQMDTDYFVKVSFKTLCTSEEKYSSVMTFKTGGPQQPSIIEHVLINDTTTNHVLNISCSEVLGKNDYEEFNKNATLEISNTSNFSIIVDSLTNITQVINFTTGNVNYLKGNLYLRVKYDGYYFGETPYSDTLVLPLGGITKPSLSTPVIQYNEISEDLMEAYVLLHSSEIVLPSNRKDTHTNSKWLLCLDVNKTEILTESFTDELTDKKILVDLNETQKVFAFVKYFCPYFIESEWSEPYEISLPSFIFTPVIISPTTDSILVRENVTVEVKPFKSIPLIDHTSTHWKVTSDELGVTVIWENDSSTDKLSIQIPEVNLSYGEKYYVHVTFKSGTVVSKTSKVPFEIKAVGSLNVTILPEQVNTDGAQWKIVGTDVWYNTSQLVENILIGNYQIEYKNLLPKWKELPVKDVVISKNTLTTVEETYVINGGNLQVSLLPIDVIAGGCKWRRVDTVDWLDSGAIAIGILAGTYEVEFFTPDVNAFIAPANKYATIVNATTTVLEAEYTLVGVPGVTLEELKINHPQVISGKKRVPPVTVTVDIIDGEGTIEPLSKTVPYRTATSFDVVGGFVISSNDENIVVGGTLK